MKFMSERKEGQLPAIADLRAAVARQLPEGTAFEDGDDLVSLGLDSLRIMKVVNQLRRKGVKVSFAQFISEPTLANWKRLAEAACRGAGPRAAPATPEKAEPAPARPAPDRLPMTALQQAYFAGRQQGQTLGDVGCHAYLEFDSRKGRALKPAQVQEAWKRLLDVHPMLRASFSDQGTFSILPRSPLETVKIHDLSGLDAGAAEKELAELRGRLSHRKMQVEKGEVAGLEMCLLPGERTRLLFDAEMIAIDLSSLCRVLGDLARACQGRELESEGEGFAGWLAGEGADSPEEVESARAYWTGRLESMPGAPDIPLAVQPEAVRQSRVVRRRHHLPAGSRSALDDRAKAYGLTSAATLLAAYAETLARWSSSERFLLNLPISDRRDASAAIAGEFTKIEVLEVDLARGGTFVEHARTIQEQLHRDMDHSAWTGVSVLRELARTRGVKAPFVFAGGVEARLLEEEEKEVLGDIGCMISQTSQVWLDCQLYTASDGGLVLVWDAVEELYPAGLLDSMFQAFCGLVENLARAAAGGDGRCWDAPLDALHPLKPRGHEPAAAVVRPEERRALLYEGFFAHAGADPGRTALVSAMDGATVSYGELASRALRIAGRLKRAGVEPGELVAVTLPRDPLQIAAVLGVQAAGAAYAPVSIGQPLFRRARIHRNAGIRFALTGAEQMRDLPWPEDCTCIDIAEALCADPLQAPAETDPGALAYVIFTSGSTGEPKGVEIQHHAATNTIQAVNRLCGVGAGDRAIAVSAMDFDLSVYDVFGMLDAGGSLVVLSEETSRNAEFWRDAAVKYGVTVWNSVPMLADMLVTAAEAGGVSFPRLRCAMMSGDWIPLALPDRLRALAPAASVAAMGGATEASIWSNVCFVPSPVPAGWKSIPYGTALPGQCFRVMSPWGSDCPDWTVGELWIGGLGLARGYRADSDKTAQAFVEKDGMRWYRTGDMGRFWPDGTIEFLGRRDFQVKLRGHRIELGEISSALCQHEGVEEAAVSVAREPSGASVLVGYVVPKKACRAPEAPELEAFLRGRVPDYMVVHHYVFMERLPLTANGKVDRKKLPAPDFSQVQADSSRPFTETEARLAALWERIIPGSRPGLAGSFFEEGGDSLLAIRLASSVKQEFGIDFGIDRVLASPTLEGMAKQIEAVRLGEAEGSGNGFPDLARHWDERFEPFQLNDVQQAYVVGRSGAYALGGSHARYYCELDSLDLDIPRLLEAWKKLIARHDTMRAFVRSDGRQQVMPEAPDFEAPVRDLRGHAGLEAELERLRAELPNEDGPASGWPLFGMSFTLMDERRTRIHLSFDNVMYDGASVYILLDEWARLYRNPSLELRPLDVTFRDYLLGVAGMAHSAAVERDRAYWKARIPEIFPAPALALAKEPSAVKSQRFARRSFTLSLRESQALHSQASERGMTVSGVLMAAYALVLARWSQSPRLTLNLTLFHRVPFVEDVQKLVGDFTSLTLLSVDASLGKSFAEMAGHLQNRLWSDLAHPLAGGLEVMRGIARAGGQAAMPVVFTSGIGLEGGGSGQEGIGSLAYAITQTPQVWLDHQCVQQDGRLVLSWDAVEELFGKEMLDEMFGTYERLVRRLAQEPGAWEERHPEKPGVQALADRANSTREPLPQGTLLDAFEKTAAAFGGRPAVIAPDRTLSYSALAARARALAARIKALDPGPLAIVMMEKGWEQAVAVVAALYAGSGWLPVEADVPRARLEAMLASSGASVVVTQERLASRLDWPQGVKLVAVPEEAPEGGAPASDPGPRPKPDDVAYVIYTSGSTGKPKGVAITHRAVLNTVLDVNRRFKISGRDRTFALSHLSFDLSVYDLWGPFVCGGCCVMPEHGSDRDPSRWIPLLERHGASVWNSVPALFQMLADYVQAKGDAMPESLKTVMLSGDWIPLGLPGQARDLGCRAALYSLGGATEASIWSIYYPIGEVDSSWKSIPYGRPLANQRFHVYDEALQERPAGVPGELYIAGDGLAQCYWNDPERTAPAFFEHPETGERLYRTGDIGVRRLDGDIDFIGRADFQVKIRGFRIELGEIEAAANAVAAVASSVAFVAGSTASDRRIVAAAVSAGADAGEVKSLVLASCREKLPPYMVPSQVLCLKELPLSSNGKIDRKALVRMAEEQVAREPAAGQVLASTSRERQIAGIWESLLNRRGIGVGENFFEAGGSSVLAMKLFQEVLAAAGRDIPLVCVFEHPTIRSLAAYLDGLDSAAGAGQAREAGIQSGAEGLGGVRMTVPASGAAGAPRHDGGKKPPVQRLSMLERRMQIRKRRSGDNAGI